MVNFQALSFFWLKRISEQEEEGKGFFWEINLIEQKWIKKKKKLVEVTLNRIRYPKRWELG